MHKKQRVTFIKQTCLYRKGRYIDEYLKSFKGTNGLDIYGYIIKLVGPTCTSR